MLPDEILGGSRIDGNSIFYELLANVQMSVARGASNSSLGLLMDRYLKTYQPLILCEQHCNPGIHLPYS
jgi:hypothetical protein